MKFVKGISLFFIYPLALLSMGFVLGIWFVNFFYPGEQTQPGENVNTRVEYVSEGNQASLETGDAGNGLEAEQLPEGGDSVKTAEESDVYSPPSNIPQPMREASSKGETLSVDTVYVLEETDIVDNSVVETTWKLPDMYVGMNREQFLTAMENYASSPPLSEQERGFVGLEVLSFSRERVVVQMNYQYLQPSTSFYLAVVQNEVVVYLEDRETIFINTGILLENLPESMQMDIIQMMWIADEEELYDFLETYSS